MTLGTQIFAWLEAAGLEQRLVELLALTVVYVHERQLADHLVDAATETRRSPLAEPMATGVGADR
jgi:hypothetical protein